MSPALYHLSYCTEIEGILLVGAVGFELTTYVNFLGRGDRIRTYGLWYPKPSRYQTAPHPDKESSPAAESVRRRSTLTTLHRSLASGKPIVASPAAESVRRRSPLGWPHWGPPSCCAGPGLTPKPSRYQTAPHPDQNSHFRLLSESGRSAGGMQPTGFATCT